MTYMWNNMRTPSDVCQEDQQAGATRENQVTPDGAVCYVARLILQVVAGAGRP
jgi:hypothetical protein